jgi:hypothetical protein
MLAEVHRINLQFFLDFSVLFLRSELYLGFVLVLIFIYNFFLVFNNCNFNFLGIYLSNFRLSQLSTNLLHLFNYCDDDLER